MTTPTTPPPPPDPTPEEIETAKLTAAAERTTVAVKMLRMCALSLARLLPTEQVEGLLVMATVGLVDDSWQGARTLVAEGRQDLISPQMIDHMYERATKAALAMRGGLEILEEIVREIAALKAPVSGDDAPPPPAGPRRVTH